MTRLLVWFRRQFWSGVVFAIVLVLGLLLDVPLGLAVYGALVVWAVAESVRVGPEYEAWRRAQDRANRE